MKHLCGMLALFCLALSAEFAEAQKVTARPERSVLAHTAEGRQIAFSPDGTPLDARTIAAMPVRP